MDASTPEEMPITSQITAAPSASDAVTGDPLPDQRRDGRRVVVRVAEVAVQQAREVVEVLREDRPVEAEALRHERDRLRRRLAPGDQLRDVRGRDEEHHEHDGRDRPQDGDPEQYAAERGRRPTGYLRNNRSPRGSNASRTLSPSRLKARVVISSAAPGKSTYHQATR